MNRKFDEQINDFLKISGWENAEYQFIKSDASSRRYIRLFKDGKTKMLMDARNLSKKVTLNFYLIGEILRDHGLSVPQIYTKELENSLILMEDFGNASFSKLMRSQPQNEEHLYQLAIDMLFHLRSLPPPQNFSVTSVKSMTKMIEPFFTDYLSNKAQKNMKSLILERIYRLFEEFDGSFTTVSLRDCHADNLIFLNDRQGFSSVGLLDFQDAFLCHPAYDLVSLLQDARRYVSKNLEKRMIKYYLSRTKDNQAKFIKAYKCLGLQRNLRILGVFAGLARIQRKSFYATLIPRVITYIQRTLRDPIFDPLYDDLMVCLAWPEGETKGERLP